MFHSCVLDLVIVRSRNQTPLMWAELLKAGPGCPRPPISLMDGSCAANVIRAGSGLGGWEHRDWPIQALQ